MRILNFGSLNIDKVYGVARFVEAGETVSARSFSQNVGGKGLNQSVALARAGAAVCHAGCIGADGEFLAAYLEQSGVDITHLRRVDTPTGHAIIQVDEAGQNCILIHGGANQCVTEEQIAAVLAAFGAGDWLLLQNEISGIDTLIQKAHQKGMTVVLNPSPITKSLLKAPLELVDWFLLNETEGAALTGETDVNAMAAGLTARFPGAQFVLTLGAAGARYIGNGTEVTVPAQRVTAVDTTAAGDTFTGYFLQSITAGETVETALHRATRAAGIAVGRPGAADSIPTKDEVE
ncbi:MAG: ribokinase [Clostridia bacterium]|nr:ribokinase [Clostridia bacterium]